MAVLEAVVPPAAIIQPATEAQIRLAQASGVPSSGRKLIFSEDFNSLKIGKGKGRWGTTFFWGGRTLPSNGEEQIFVDKEMKDRNGAVIGVDPFVLNKGILSIQAEHTPDDLVERLEGHAYTSGLLTTYTSFAFTYGTVEVRARPPRGKGFLPAIWLLRKDAGRLGEIDIMEVLGDRTNFLNSTVHYRATPDQPELTTVKFVRRPTVDLSADFHVYRLEWTPETISVFLDNVEMGQMKTPDALRSPMYLLLGMAVGGKWPGRPNEKTPFPASFDVDYIRVWSHP